MQIGYSQSDLFNAIPYFASKESKKNLEVLYHLEKSSAFFNRPTYEQLLMKLELVKQRIKDLLTKSESTEFDCDGLRNSYEAMHNEKLELVHRQLGYYSLLDLLKTISDIPWRNPRLDKAENPLLICSTFTDKYRSARQIVGSEKVDEDVLTRKFYELRERLLHIPFKNQFIPCQDICNIYRKKYNEDLEAVAMQIGYSQSDLFNAIPYFDSKESKKSMEVLYHLEKSSAFFNRPTYEQLLMKLELVKGRIKNLLTKSESTEFDCDELRNAYEAMHNEKLELVHHQLGYYSLLDLLKTIPDIPWRIPLLDKAGCRLRNSMFALEQTPNGSNTDEMISRQRQNSEQHKVEDDGNYSTKSIQGHLLYDDAMNSDYLLVEPKYFLSTQPCSSTGIEPSENVEYFSSSDAGIVFNNSDLIIRRFPKQSRSTQFNENEAQYRSATQVIGSERMNDDVLTRKEYSPGTMSALTNKVKQFYDVSEQLITLTYLYQCSTQDQLSTLYKKKMSMTIQSTAERLGYISDTVLLEAIPILNSIPNFIEHSNNQKMQKSNETKACIMGPSVFRERPTYEELLERLELTKERIKELLINIEMMELDCKGLRNVYEGEYKDRLELVHRQLGYYSLLDLLKTIPDIAWNIPILDKVGYPLLNSASTLDKIPNCCNTNENDSPHEYQTTKSE